MKIYRFPDTKPWKILITLLMLALLYLSRDSMFSMMAGITNSVFLTAGLILALGVLFLAVHFREWKELLQDKRILFALVSCLIFLVPMAVKRDWQLMYFSVLMCILGCVLVSFFTSLEDLAKFYVVTLTVLGAWTVLATYLLRIPGDMGMIRYPVFHNSVGVAFYVPLFSVVSISYVPMRNFGIFREPGVYQYFILLALYLTFYQVKWRKERNMWICCGVLAVTMLTTLATGGVAEMGMLALLVFIDKKYYKDRFLRFLAIAAVTALLAACVYSLVTETFLYSYIREIFAKLFVGSGESVKSRVGSLVVNGRLFLESPLVGAKLRDVLHGIANNTSSTTILFAMLGIFGGVYHVAGWVCLVWQKKERWLPQLLLLAILLLSFNTCNVMWNIWLWMLPTVALCQKGLPLLRKSK